MPSNALAEGADGIYKVTSTGGSIIIDGDAIDIPKTSVKKATQGQTAVIVVKKQKIMINRNAAAILLKQIADKSKVKAKINPKVKGPLSLTLVPTEGGYTGKTMTPVISKMTITDEGKKVTVTIKTEVVAVVKGDSMTLTSSFTATGNNETLKGDLIVTAKR